MRTVVTEFLNKETPLTERENRIIQNCIDLSIQESMVAYFLVHGRIREQFVATLTHDLRNPIGTAKGAAEEIQEVLKEKELSEATVADILDLCTRIVRSARRADCMIQNMLDASVIQTGESLSLHLAPCDIQEIVVHAVDEMPIKFRSRIQTQAISVKGWWDADVFNVRSKI